MKINIPANLVEVILEQSKTYRYVVAQQLASIDEPSQPADVWGQLKAYIQGYLAVRGYKLYPHDLSPNPQTRCNVSGVNGHIYDKGFQHYKIQAIKCLREWYIANNKEANFIGFESDGLRVTKDFLEANWNQLGLHYTCGTQADKEEIESPF